MTPADTAAVEALEGLLQEAHGATRPLHDMSEWSQKARSALSLLRSALEQGEPEGWKLVPLVPTEDMHVAAVRTIVRCAGNDDFPPRVWRAMLAASPIPPITPVEAGKVGVASGVPACDSNQEKTHG